MGYYVATTEVNVRFEKAKLDDALTAMKKMMSPEFAHKRTAGVWTYGKHVTQTYRWMPQDFSSFVSLEEFLEELGFEDNTTTAKGDLMLGHYDNKSGDEQVFFEYLAPFITAGSWVGWSGEEGEIWRWRFDGTKLINQYCTFTWHDYGSE